MIQSLKSLPRDKRGREGVVPDRAVEGGADVLSCMFVRIPIDIPLPFADDFTSPGDNDGEADEVDACERL